MTQSNATFAPLNLSAELLSRLAELNYQTPTPVQLNAIPAVLAGKDLLAGAKTGSGKTAAFALPLLQQLSNTQMRGKGNQVRALALVPTRELAQQVADSVKSYGRNLTERVKVQAVYGGVSINTQMLGLRGGCDLLVATPGRLLDLYSSNAIKFDQLQTLVLDEADRLLSLGFTEELEQILAKLPAQKQTLFFSATFPEEVNALTERLLCAPVKVELQSEAVATLKQQVFTVNKNRKTALLAHLIKSHAWSQVLVFASSKKTCTRLEQKLGKAGVSTRIFHGDQAQGARMRVLNEFKQGKIEVLIATDIAARGIDIEKLPVVINYELPRSPSDYMHRIGRSGRAGEAGLALSLIAHDEYHHFKVIEKKNKIRLEREQIEGFEADAEAPEDCPSRAAKPVIPAAGMGKKKRKKQLQAAADIWANCKPRT